MIGVSPPAICCCKSSSSVAYADRIYVAAFFMDCCPAVISATKTHKNKTFNCICYLFTEPYVINDNDNYTVNCLTYV